MKVLYTLFLIVLLAVVGLFAFQNSETVEVTFWDQKKAFPFPGVIAAAYVLGMLSGWTVVGLLRRSWRYAVEERR